MTDLPSHSGLYKQYRAVVYEHRAPPSYLATASSSGGLVS